MKVASAMAGFTKRNWRKLSMETRPRSRPIQQQSRQQDYNVFKYSRSAFFSAGASKVP
jgi:hypothetical protein